MNFFDRQRAARGSTVRLVFLFTTAVIAIVVVLDAVVLLAARSQPRGSLVALLIGVTAFTILIIAGGTITKTIALRAGGSAVALSVGAVPIDPTTTDPTLKRFVNIVEEMSLASGVPMPRLFVMQQEPGINAFAAGYGPADAAITVTAGALQQLNRDELQGVIGHEFSHVLNGDMRLNIKLIGLLNGILLIGFIGLRVLQFGGRDKKGGVPIIAIAAAMAVLGFVGQFFASMIKAAVSRQREWLADASAVQFTRQTTGLEGALKKIAGVPTGSALQDKRSAQEVSHMLFGEGSHVAGLFATHPPLVERIKALDPSFRPEQVEQLKHDLAGGGSNELAASGRTSGFAAAPTTAEPIAESDRRLTAVSPAEVAARTSTMTQDDLARGARLNAQIPAHVRQVASQPSSALPFVLAMLLDDEAGVSARQVALIAAQLGRSVADATAQMRREIGQLPAILRLPVVSLAVPLVVQRPRAELTVLVSVLDALARADGSISLFEYCLTRLVGSYVRDAQDPQGRSKIGTVDVTRVQGAAITVLTALAAAGNTDPAKAQHAFAAGIARLVPGATPPYALPGDLLTALDAAWPPLDSLDPKYKQTLIEAMVTTVLDDGVLAANEAELLRTACALLHCPLPSLVA